MAHFADWFYLVAAVLFILALRGLSSPLGARMGNLYGMIGMAISVVVTYFLAKNTGDIILAIAFIYGLCFCRRCRRGHLARTHRADDADA